MLIIWSPTQSLPTVLLCYVYRRLTLSTQLLLSHFKVQPNETPSHWRRHPLQRASRVVYLAMLIPPLTLLELSSSPHTARCYSRKSSLNWDHLSAPLHVAEPGSFRAFYYNHYLFPAFPLRWLSSLRIPCPRRFSRYNLPRFQSSVPSTKEMLNTQ